jgi:hypothetical protein
MSEKDAGANAASDAMDMRGRESPFGGLTPSEAAQRRWSGAREAREQDIDTLTPLAKQRKALEKKAESGDVYAIRELREHHEYWYGTADAQPLYALATPLQLQAWHAIATDVRAGVESEWLREAPVPDPPLH